MGCKNGLSTFSAFIGVKNLSLGGPENQLSINHTYGWNVTLASCLACVLMFPSGLRKECSDDVAK